MPTIADVPNMQLVTRESDNGHATAGMIEYNKLGDVIRGTQTKPVIATYSSASHSAKAITWEVRERGAASKRTFYYLWLGDMYTDGIHVTEGMVTAHTARGNYRGGTYRELVPTHVVELDDLKNPKR